MPSADPVSNAFQEAAEEEAVNMSLRESFLWVKYCISVHKYYLSCVGGCVRWKDRRMECTPSPARMCTCYITTEQQPHFALYSMSIAGDRCCCHRESATMMVMELFVCLADGLVQSIYLPTYIAVKAPL